MSKKLARLYHRVPSLPEVRVQIQISQLQGEETPSQIKSNQLAMLIQMTFEYFECDQESADDVRSCGRPIPREELDLSN